MSNVGKPDFEFERLCSIFGLAAVRKASLLNLPSLMALEGFLRLLDNEVTRSSDISLF